MKISRSMVIYSKISNLLLKLCLFIEALLFQSPIKHQMDLQRDLNYYVAPHLPLTHFTFSCIYRGQSVHWKKYKVQSSKLLRRNGKAGLQCRGMYTTLKTFMNVITIFVIRCMHDLSEWVWSYCFLETVPSGIDTAVTVIL